MAVGWLDALDIIIEIMSTRIYKCRMNWIAKPPNEVVGRVQQIIQSRWEASVHSTVIELNQRDGIFMVSNNKAPVVETNVDANNDATVPVVLSSRSATHSVNLAMRECTCGAWQDLLYPCRHACAVYKHHYHKTLHDMMDLVHPFYKFKSMHALYSLVCSKKNAKKVSSGSHRVSFSHFCVGSWYDSTQWRGWRLIYRTNCA